ncbi:MAG TPA: ABC transporter permease [Saprospiraceae bacterium]|nr:ABC transporter permease [Saprospiraceae bacterium]
MANNKTNNLGLNLIRNKWTGICIIILCLYFLTAVFAYLLAPDNSTDANEQITEIALHSPGTSIKVVQIKRPEIKENPIIKFFKGTKMIKTYIPIINYTVYKDSIRLIQYKGINPFTKKKIPTQVSNYSLNIFITSNTNGKKIPVTAIKNYPFATDGYGRCILSRIIIGSRISMTVGILAVIISLTMGVVVGLLAGYSGGKIDDFLMLLINTIWSIPTLLLVFAIVMAMGRGIQIIYLAVGLTLWVDVARIVRGQVLSLKENIYIDAARSLGYGKIRIVRKHILPNILGPILVVATGNFATAIILEAGLSYLGFGIQPPRPSWGNMLNENYGYALSGNYLVALIPALAIVVLVLSVNIIGNGLRDAYDVKID